MSNCDSKLVSRDDLYKAQRQTTFISDVGTGGEHTTVTNPDTGITVPTINEIVRDIKDRGDAVIEDVTYRGNEAVNNVGFEVPTPYASDIDIDRVTQTVIYQDNVYHAINVPFVTSGTFEGDSHWELLRGALKSELYRPNLFPNHNFLIQTPEVTQPRPNATPRTYPVDYQVFSGVFASSDEGVGGLTYDKGCVNAASGSIYFIVPNTGSIFYVDDFVASIAGVNLKPNRQNVSFQLIGDNYKISINFNGPNGASDVFSCKFEQGITPTVHEVQYLKGAVYTFNTVGEMLNMAPPVGSNVEWLGYHKSSDGGSNKGIVKRGPHTHDGGFIFSIDANTYIESDLSSRVIDVRKFGAQYGKSQGFQNQFIINALKYLNDSASNEINPITKTGRVLYNGLLHIGPQQIQIPPYCSFELDGYIPDSISFGPGGFALAPDDMPILWFDVSYTEKVIPFCISGYWQAGGVNPGQLINLATENVTSGDNDLGYVQTNRGAKFKAICFTDKFCVAPVQVAAGHESEIEISASEFLHPYVVATSWGIKAKIGGFNHHSGGCYYNVNGFRISGYSNKSSAGGAPALDASTFIPQWGPESGTQNPPALRGMTVGTSGVYGSGIDTSGLLQQSWNRARFCQNVNGWFEGGAYYESITNILWHSVSSFFTSLTPRITMTGGGIFRCGGATSGEISNPTYSSPDNIPSWDGGIVTAYPDAKMRVTLRDQESHQWPDHPQIKFDFLSPDDLTIKVDPVNGDDLYSGLSESKKVRTIDRALEMSAKYKAIDVVIDHGTIALVENLTDYPASVRFVSSDITQVNPTIQPEVSGGVLDGGIAISDQIVFDHVDVNCQGTTGSGSARGLIRAISGTIRVTCRNMTLTTELNSGLIVAGEGASSQSLTFVFDRSVKAGTGNIGVNAFGSNGSCRTILASTTNIDSLWESNYSLIL